MGHSMTYVHTWTSIIYYNIMEKNIEGFDLDMTMDFSIVHFNELYIRNYLRAMSVVVPRSHANHEP